MFLEVPFLKVPKNVLFKKILRKNNKATYFELVRYYNSMYRLAGGCCSVPIGWWCSLCRLLVAAAVFLAISWWCSVCRLLMAAALLITFSWLCSVYRLLVVVALFLAISWWCCVCRLLVAVVLFLPISWWCSMCAGCWWRLFCSFQSADNAPCVPAAVGCSSVPSHQLMVLLVRRLLMAVALFLLISWWCSLCAGCWWLLWVRPGKEGRRAGPPLAGKRWSSTGTASQMD